MKIWTLTMRLALQLCWVCLWSARLFVRAEFGKRTETGSQNDHFPVRPRHSEFGRGSCHKTHHALWSRQIWKECSACATLPFRVIHWGRMQSHLSYCQTAIMVKFHFLSSWAWEESVNPRGARSLVHPCLFWRDLISLGYRTYFASRYQSFRAESIAQMRVFINRVRSFFGVSFSQIDRKWRVSDVFVIFHGAQL